MRLAVCFWWFIVSNWLSGHVAATQGPFADQAQCEHYRQELFAFKNGLVASSCWWDGRRP